MGISIVTGDDVVLAVQLRRDGDTFNIPSGAIVQSALRSHGTALMTPVQSSSTAPGADWTTSLITIDLPASITETLPLGSAELEVEVDDNGKTTWVARGVEIDYAVIVD